MIQFFFLKTLWVFISLQLAKFSIGNFVNICHFKNGIFFKPFCLPLVIFFLSSCGDDAHEVKSANINSANIFDSLDSFELSKTKQSSAEPLRGLFNQTNQTQSFKVGLK